VKTGFARNLWTVLLTAGIGFSLVLALPMPVNADMGPKPSITIVVRNPPDGEYYLDLLIQEDKAHSNTEDERDQYDAAKYKLLEDYNQDGWTPALVHGTKVPLFGKLTGTSQGSSMVHTFSYFGTPEQFKIIIVTPDNQIVVSRELVRSTFQLTLTYEYTTGAINQRSLFVAYLLQILSTLLPTLIIEGLLLVLFRFSLRQNFWPFLLVNLATQVLMTATLGTAAITQGMLTAYFLTVPIELAIIILESIGFTLWFKQHSKKRRIGYAITANIVSMAAGIIAMSISFA
jgi:hypothetical protein